MILLAIIEGEKVLLHEDGSVTYRSGARIDCDGSGDLHGDPCAQPDTTLHLHGKALNADVDKYAVVPPAIISGVGPVVMGCLGKALNTRNGRESFFVTGDRGPHKKLGEISVALAKALGINPSPTTGGEEAHVIEYTLWPGTPAVVDGKAYALQRS